MARMIPSSIHPDCASQGEKELFNEFKNDQKTKDWIVLHSLDIAHHVKRTSGEVDFVVIIPSLGIVCLEVKACTAIKREHGKWFYGSDPKPDLRGPFRQASQAMHSLRKNLIRKAPAFNEILFWSAAVFPFIEFSIRSDEWHDWQVIDCKSLRTRSILQEVERVLKCGVEHLKTKRQGVGVSTAVRGPTKEECEVIISILRPDFEFFESSKLRSSRSQQELKVYTDEQYLVLDGIEANARLAILGPAGTGKTLLALETARRAIANGKRVLLLCFNRLLGEYLKQQTAELGRQLLASTLHAQMLSVLGRRPDDSMKSSAFWENELPKLATQQLIENPKKENMFDELIVDEGQDFMRDSYLDFLDKSLSGGLQSGQWRFFGDFEKQAIYGAANLPLEVLVNKRAKAATFNLRVNCRNTPRVASLVHLLGGLRPEYKKILRPDDGVEPELCYYEDDEDQRALLVKTLRKFSDANYSDKEIVILSGRADTSCVAASLGSSWDERLCRFNSDSNRNVLKYCSIHAFKGLESPVIIVTDIDHILSSVARSLFYIAITRALEKLVILVHSQVKAEVREILLKPESRVGND